MIINTAILWKHRTKVLENGFNVGRTLIITNFALSKMICCYTGTIFLRLSSDLCVCHLTIYPVKHLIQACPVWTTGSAYIVKLFYFKKRWELAAEEKCLQAIIDECKGKCTAYWAPCGTIPQHSNQISVSLQKTWHN